MPPMAPQPQPQQSSPQQPVPANIGQSEPDGMPQQGGSPNMAPQSQGQPPANVGSSEPDGGPVQGGDAQQSDPATQALQQRLDALPDNDKKFLSQYLTPEFNYALGLVAGPEVAKYLNQFTDPNKVLVPVSRQEAARIQDAVKQDQAQQQQGQGQQPQGQPQAAPQGQAAPQQKPQAPMPQAQPAPQQLPNGVTPAPMQGGIMAPQG